MNEVFEELMQDDTYRKGLGQRIKQLRKERGWPQKVLANRIGTSAAQLNKYEGGQNVPSLDRLVLFAELLSTTIDYLIVGTPPDGTPFNNTRLVQRLQLIDQFDAEEKEIVIRLLDAMIAKHNMEATARALR